MPYQREHLRLSLSLSRSARFFKRVGLTVTVLVFAMAYRAGHPPRTSVPPPMPPTGTWTWDEYPDLPTSTAYVEIVRFNTMDDPYHPSLYAFVVNPSRKDLKGFSAKCANIAFSTDHPIYAGNQAMLELGFDDAVIGGGTIDPFHFDGKPVRCAFVRANFQSSIRWRE